MEHQGIWFYTSFHSQHLVACLVHGRCPVKSISMGVFFFLGLYFSQYTIHRFSHQLTQAPPHRYWVCKKEKSGSVAQSCPTLCDPIGCSPPGFSVHGILQARILEWVAISFSRGIFPTQGSNPGLPHCRQILHHLSHQGSPTGAVKPSTIYCLVSGSHE